MKVYCGDEGRTRVSGEGSVEEFMKISCVQAREACGKENVTQGMRRSVRRYSGRCDAVGRVRKGWIRKNKGNEWEMGRERNVRDEPNHGCCRIYDIAACIAAMLGIK